MAILGKRKSRQEASGVSELDAEEIFRRHFEAQFEPLDDDDAAKQRQQRDEDDGDEDEDEDEDGWDGFSSEHDEEESDDDAGEQQEDAPVVQVIDHSRPQAPKEPTMSKRELKAFMSSKVIDHTAPRPSTDPSSSSSSSKTPTTTSANLLLPEDAPSLLAQDLELRRLLSESHLLTPSHNNAASASVFSSSVVHGSAAAGNEPKAFAAGRTRLRATDLRLQALGARTSVLKQDKMPMQMRKGIVAAAGAREAKRRREAKENGVILERSVQGTGKKKKQQIARRRERGGGVDGPGIGRFKGAELRISESDVRKIEGSRDTFGRRGRGRR